HDDYQNEFMEYSANASVDSPIPIEYYTPQWKTFANGILRVRPKEVTASLVDTTRQGQYDGLDKYMTQLIANTLSPKQRAQLSLGYKSAKSAFLNNDDVASINAQLDSLRGDI